VSLPVLFLKLFENSIGNAAHDRDLGNDEIVVKYFCHDLAMELPLISFQEGHPSARNRLVDLKKIEEFG
jgi:hypothetical protein